MNEIVADSFVEDLPRHPRWRYASNATYNFTATVMTAAYSIFLFFYYEVVLGLNPWLIFLALSIWTVYDAINDPFIGFLVDRNTRLTRRWGRRFPWIVIGIVPWCLSFYLIFSAPDIDATKNPWPIFWWLLMSLVLFDTFGTIVGINVSSLRPDLFRTEQERRTFTGYWATIDMLAQVLGFIIPPLFLGAGGGKASYAIMGAMVAFIALIGAILFIPSAREDKVVIDRYYSGEYERMSFFKGVKEVLKQKSFIVFFIAVTAFQIATQMMMSNAIYVVIFVLGASADVLIIIFALLLLGALISVPFWLMYLKKTNNNKKALTVGGFTFAAALIPMTFFQTEIDLFIMVFILGFAMGSMWAFFYTIIQANVIDDFVARTKKNQKGILLGTSVFIGRLAATIDEFIIATVHSLTGFVPGKETYPELAASVADINLVLWGIRLLQGVIPGIIILIGTLIFWKYYPLTQDVVLKNKEALEKLGF
jgi:GPH family glycoside/pentoside/hexuronide:cation symporter